MTGENNVLKVLCLHGYRQTGTTFREKTGAFRKLLKKKAEFVFITAPLTVPPTEEDQEKDNGCGWWFSRPDKYFKAHYESDYAIGFEDSLKAIEKAFEEFGPFDGILGFSQGAAMLGLVCGLQQQGKLPYSFKFAIFASSFNSRSTPHKCLYAEKITIPTLHVYGEEDQVIQKPMSEEFLQNFQEPRTLVHPGGHFMPATGAVKPIYLQFFDDMKQLCQN